MARKAFGFLGIALAITMLLVAGTRGDPVDGTRIKNYKYGARAYISFAVSQSVVPEPGTMALFGIGVMAPMIAAWRRRKK
ncbi:MAG: hypothetical protein KatS3mg023_0372 [Armatimonadota bacterium]|nr:MAG: hypothetical protein KatS3mg023_0372 [Armatimonadota bacterium]